MNWLRAYWKNAALALIALVLLQLSYQKGLDAGMASGQIDPSWRYRFYSAPIVLSQIYYGRPYDYVGYHKLAIPFQAPTPSMDELLEQLKAVENVGSSGLFFILADDKGIVDFTRLAFELYGIRAASLYHMYFTIVFASCVLFVCGYFADRHKLAMLVFLCLGLYTTMPGFLTYPPGISILDTHAACAPDHHGGAGPHHDARGSHAIVKHHADAGHRGGVSDRPLRDAGRRTPLPSAPRPAGRPSRRHVPAARLSTTSIPS